MHSTVESPATGMPRICVVVVSWNGREHLRYSLPAALALEYPNYEVLLIDNASTDGSIDEVETIWPAIRVMKNEANIGYTGAVNAGFRYASEHDFDYVLVMTNDIILDRRCLSAAVQIAQQDRLAAMVGFNMLGAVSYAPYEEFLRCSQEWQELIVKEVHYVEGAAFLSDPRIILRIGGFDETLFMYGDENDLENRLARAGYHLLRVNVPVWHNASRNVKGERRLHAAYYAIRNTLIIVTKNHSLLRAFKQLLSIMRISCSPFRSIPESEFARRRTRPSSIFVNGIVVASALCSYLFRLPEVLRTRKRDQELIAAEQKRLSDLGYG